MRFWREFIIILLSAVCFFSIKSCSDKEEYQLSTDQKLALYKGQIGVYINGVNKYGEMVSTQKALIMERDKKLEEVLLDHSNLKKLNEQIRITSETRIKNVIAQYASGNVYRVDTIRINDSTEVLVVDSSCIKVGSPFNNDDKWYSLHGKVGKFGALIDSLSFKDTLTINVGLNTKSIFKKHTVDVEAIHSSPYTKTTGMQNIIFKDKTKWYNKRLTIFGYGVVVGVAGIIAANVYLFH